MIERTVMFSIPIEELTELIGKTVEEKLKVYAASSLEESKELPSKEFLSREEVLEMLHVTSTTLWRYTREGKLKYHRIGRKMFFKLEEVRQAMSTA